MSVKFLEIVGSSRPRNDQWLTTRYDQQLPTWQRKRKKKVNLFKENSSLRIFDENRVWKLFFFPLAFSPLSWKSRCRESSSSPFTSFFTPPPPPSAYHIVFSPEVLAVTMTTTTRASKTSQPAWKIGQQGKGLFPSLATYVSYMYAWKTFLELEIVPPSSFLDLIWRKSWRLRLGASVTPSPSVRREVGVANAWSPIAIPEKSNVTRMYVTGHTWAIEGGGKPYMPRGGNGGDPPTQPENHPPQGGKFMFYRPPPLPSQMPKAAIPCIFGRRIFFGLCPPCIPPQADVLGHPP